LVARANTEFVRIGLDRVRSYDPNDQDLSLGAPRILGSFPPAAIKFAEFSPKINLKSSNNQTPSAKMAGPMEAL
jgi:hypothetical protein